MEVYGAPSWGFKHFTLQDSTVRHHDRDIRGQIPDLFHEILTIGKFRLQDPDTRLGSLYFHSGRLDLSTPSGRPIGPSYDADDVMSLHF